MCIRDSQNALLAGLMTAKEKADMTISLDADLQDDVDVIDQMVEKYYQGNDVVYGCLLYTSDPGEFRRRLVGYAALLQRARRHGAERGGKVEWNLPGGGDCEADRQALYRSGQHLSLIHIFLLHRFFLYNVTGIICAERRICQQFFDRNC